MRGLIAAIVLIGVLRAESFEVASIKAISPATPVQQPQIDRANFVIAGTLFDFITSAYGFRPCARRVSTGMHCNLIVGEPAWGAKDKFEIRAKLPADSPAVARNQFADGEAPRLDRMLQSLLEDRFRLKSHRETRELPVYLITITAKSASKLKPSDGPILRHNADGSTYKIQDSTNSSHEIKEPPGRWHSSTSLFRVSPIS